MSAEFGIIGKPLTHSFSPAYFNERFTKQALNLRYAAFPLDSIASFPALLAAQPHLRGLNVTIPYKTAVIPFLDFISEDAHQIGAVNCIRIHEKQLYGYNTDIYGFKESLRPLLLGGHNRALILGDGGSSKAVQAGLAALSTPYDIVSRSGQTIYKYEQLTPSLMHEYSLVINTTPLGMFPNTAEAPNIPYEGLSSAHLLYDLIYNPEETRFLQLGRAQGATIANGYQMLLLQAERSWELWTELVSEPIKRA